jgi:BirA family transcriptional regulator, biotin operon repressor / biotin---[acetyl-CoA-carboxylase] ligase
MSSLSLAAIKPLLSQNIDIELFDTIASTNDYLLAKKQINKPTICLAETQTKGKGRLGREWCSPSGKNIYLSCRYAFDKPAAQLTGLSLAMSLAVCEMLSQFGLNEGVSVKWPNDVLVHGKKLAGILIELQADKAGNAQAVIGIGVNVNMTAEDAASITQPWTSMLLSSAAVDLNTVAAALINSMLIYLERFKLEGFASFFDEWRQRDFLIRQVITIQYLDEQIHGEVMGVNEQGQLLLMTKDGEVRGFSVGEATIVK